MRSLTKVFNMSYNSDNMDAIAEKLKELGLGDYEAMVYSVLLAASPANATFIAKKCELSRSSVYTTLSSLIAKGLVGVTYKNDVKQFIAQDYVALEEMVKKEKEIVDKKAKLVQEIRESMTQFTRTDTQLPEIIFFEGQEGLKKIYASMMRQAPMGAMRYFLRDEFVWQPQWEFSFEKDWQDHVERFKTEKKMTTKLLVNPSKEEKERLKPYRAQKTSTYKFLSPKNAIHQFAMYIIGDTTAIMSMEKNNLVGIKISNAHMASNFKQVFESLWASSKSE
jgi:predicted transcriptional regulator